MVYLATDIKFVLDSIPHHWGQADFPRSCFPGFLIAWVTFPGVIVHGRYDLCTPISIAWELHKAWPQAEYRVAPDSGHAMTEPGIIAELVRATEAFKTRPA